MKRFIITLTIFIVFLVGVFFFGFQRLASITIGRLFNQFNTGPIQLTYQQVTFSFPLNIKIVELSLSNNDFSFHAPQMSISFNWGLLFGKDKSIIASIPTAVFSSHSNNFIQNIKDFQFHHVPDFEIDIQNLNVPNSTYTLEAFPMFLQKKNETISFQINHPKITMTGDVISEKEIHTEYQILHGDYPLKGQLIFSFNDDFLKGTVKGEMDFSFSTLLAHKEDGIEFRDLQIQQTTGEKGSFYFYGESRLWLKDQPHLHINGQIKTGTIKNAFDVNLNLHLKNLLEIIGDLHIKTKEPKIDIIASLNFLPESSGFSLQLLPGSIIEGNPILGEIQGKYSDQRINLEFVTQPMDVQFAGISGKGTIRGNASFFSGSFKAEGQLISEWLQYQNYRIEKIELQFQYNLEKILFQAVGQLFDGKITMDGAYFNKQLQATGSIENSKIDQFIGGDDLPLNGHFSGNFEVQKPNSDPLILSLVVTNGTLFWNDTFLGNQLTAHLNYLGEKMIITDISLRNQDGVIQGEIEKEFENIKGNLHFTNYTISYPIGERSFKMKGEGVGSFQYLEGRLEITADFFAPNWSYDQWSGTHFKFQGEISPETILIKKCETQLLGGDFSLIGEIIPYKSINLIGTVKNLEFPDNDYQFQGKIQEILLRAQGAWDSVSFGINAQGQGFIYQGQPLGETFQITIEGEGALPKKNEKIGFERYLDPEMLRKGDIQIQSVYFEQEIDGGYHVKGQGDIDAQLDVSNKIWNFKSQNLTLTVEDLLNFNGSMKGSFKNDQIYFQQIHLKDKTRNIDLLGSGTYHVKDKTIQVKLTSQYDTNLFLPKNNLEVYLAGNAELNLAGTINNSDYQGWIQANQGKVVQQGKDIIQFEDVLLTINGKEFFISKGHGQWLGFDFNAKGTISEAGINLTFDIQGENGLLGQFDYFQGIWQGKITLQGEFSDLQAEGEIQIKNGFIDTTHLDKSQSSTAVFLNLDELFQNFPIKLKLVLKTDDNFRVMTRFIDLKLTGGLTLENSQNSIELNGRLDVTEGTYDLVTRTIPLQGYIFFGDYFGFIPQLHLEGQIEMNRYHIILKADGPLDDYEMKLQSEPPLIQEEILSLLFVGDKEAYQSLDTLDLEPHLLSALRFFLGMKGTGLKNVLFFDSIELVAPNQENEGFYGIELKKELGENASISYTHDLSGGDHSAWNFELDLNREWSFKSEFGTDGHYGWELEFTTRF
ncbi:MAG: hypothetical protein GX428_01900 [Candidatus Atribacteria bacterium]|nr:hypothetical protein [Candidatus Atribacteria bacterium]